MRPPLTALALVTLLSPLALALPCPSPCSCSPKRNGRLLAECAYRELRDVPRGLSPNVTILTLSANRLGRLGRAALAEVPELQSLWLGYNQLSALEPGALAALPQLRNLDLSHNRLAEFPWQDLRNLSALQILKLSHNRLASVPAGALAGLRELRSLWLNDNALTTLARGAFEALPSLAQLQLFHNPFNCSCKLFWLKEWAERSSVVLSKAGSTLCAAPARLRGRPVTGVPAALCVPPSAQLTYLSGGGPGQGLTLALHCSVAGSPPPEIRWRIRTAASRLELRGPTAGKAGRPRVLAFKNGTVAVPGFGKEDEGTYTCLAVNELGTREVSVRVALAEELPRDDPRAGGVSGEGHGGHGGNEGHWGHNGHQGHKGHQRHENHNGHDVHSGHQGYHGHKGLDDHQGYDGHDGYNDHDGHQGYDDHYGHGGHQGYNDHKGLSGREPAAGGLGDKLLIVYRVAHPARSAAGRLEFQLGILPLALGCRLLCAPGRVQSQRGRIQG